MRHAHLVPSLSLALALVAAGCLGADDAPNADDSSDTGSAVDTASASGATGANDAAAGAGATVGENATAPMADLPFTYSGSTPEGVCGPAGCQFASTGSEDFHVVEHAGAPTSITVTYTYAGMAPGMEFYVGLCVGEGASEDESSCDGYTTGPSPLTVTFALPGTPGGQVALSTGALSTAAAPTGVMVFGPSTFDAEGVLSFA